MKTLLHSCLATGLISVASASVTLTFDADTQGFNNVSWNTANGNTVWSPNNGGSIAVTTLVAGWSNPVSVLSLTSTPGLQAEFLQALAYGGTLTFDFTLSRSDVVGYNEGSPPGWFELVAIANSDAATGGGWDQNVLAASGFGGGIPVGPTTRTVTLGVAAGPPVENNGVLSYGVGSGWNELMIGFNTQSGSFTSATVFIDNVTLTANPIPEPGTSLLGLLASGLLLRRRR